MLPLIGERSLYWWGRNGFGCLFGHLCGMSKHLLVAAEDQDTEFLSPHRSYRVNERPRACVYL